MPVRGSWAFLVKDAILKLAKPVDIKGRKKVSDRAVGREACGSCEGEALCLVLRKMLAHLEEAAK